MSNSIIDSIKREVPATCEDQADPHGPKPLGVCRLCGRVMFEGERLYHDYLNPVEGTRIHGDCGDKLHTEGGAR